MSTLEARTAAVEDRTGRLELLFERFMAEAARDRAEARAEAARDRKAMNRRWGELAKMGTVVQDIVASSLRRIACEELGCGDERSFRPPCSAFAATTRTIDGSSTRST